MRSNCSHCGVNPATAGGYCNECHSAYRRAKRAVAKPIKPHTCTKCGHEHPGGIKELDELAQTFVDKWAGVAG